MPHRFKNVQIGNDQMWVKFDETKIIEPQKRLLYKFQCSIKPIICQSNGKFYFVDINEKYRLTHFEIMSDVQRKHVVELKLGKNQHHPHKDPRNHRVCLGKIKGSPLVKDAISSIARCLMVYNENDCYDLPDACSKRNVQEILYGGNQCQIF